MKTRNSSYDDRWDSQKTLKANMENVFALNFIPYANSDITGFYSHNQAAEKKEYNEIKKCIVDMLNDNGLDYMGEPKVTLESIYFHLRIVMGGAEASLIDFPEGQIIKQIKYVIERMEETVPALVNNQKIESLVKETLQEAKSEMKPTRR